jgi:hypothetical protein
MKGLIIKGLIIKDPWINLILDGVKTWEIRGSATNIRGVIALIQSGTKMVYGTVELYNSILLNREEYELNQAKHKVPLDIRLPYLKVYAWEFRNAKRYYKPKPYIHPQGAVIWVNLNNIYEGVN